MCGVYVINGVYGPEPTSSGVNTSSNPQVIPRPAFNGMERMCQRHGSNQNSNPPVLVRKPLCNQFIHYHISSRGFFSINSLNSLILLSLQYNVILQQFIEAVYWPEYIDSPWWSMVACRLNLWKPSTTVISMGMEHLSLVKLLLIYLNRLTTIIKYLGGCER